MTKLWRAFLALENSFSKWKCLIWRMRSPMPECQNCCAWSINVGLCFLWNKLFRAQYTHAATRTHCNTYTLQQIHTATHIHHNTRTLQYTHTAMHTHCDTHTVQRTHNATHAHCNTHTLQHTHTWSWHLFTELNTTETRCVCCRALQCVAVCCSMLQCTPVRCSVLQCVAMCCSVL